MDKKQQAMAYRVLFFVFCAANFIFLNAFILYFDDPGRFSPGIDFIAAMIVFAGLETVFAAGIFYCLLMIIRLQREEGDRRDEEDDDLLAIPPKIPRAPRKNDLFLDPPACTQSSPQNFERLLRVLVMFVVVIGVIFILFLAVFRFISG